MPLPYPIKLAIILSAAFLSGCVGLGAGLLGNDEQNLKNPRLQLSKGIVSSTEGPAPWITAGDLRQYWGSPDSIERTSQGNEHWQYNFGRRWNGIGVLVAFVPLPLMIPVGHEYIRFTIENGLVVKATTKEDAWLAMYGCVMSAMAHATGTECVFGRQTNKTRFVGDTHPFKIRVINATNGVVSIVHTDKFFISQVAPFTLAPRESRNILSHFLGEIVARNSDGKTLTYVGGPLSAYTFDSSISYLIIENHVFPIPPKYRDNWEAHLKEFAKSEESAK
jgi:hypothetical protein